MKRFYFKSMLIHLQRNKRQSFVIVLLSFLLTLFLTLCCFFRFDASAEKSVADTLQLNIEIENTHLFTNQYENLLDKEKLDQDSFFFFYDWIRQMGNNALFDSYHYSLHVKTQTESFGYEMLTGFEKDDYFEEFDRRLIDGRTLTQKEIENGVFYAVVTDDLQLKVGDTIKIGKILCKDDSLDDVYIELSVIGVLESAEPLSGEFGLFSNTGKSNGIFVSNQLLTAMIEKYRNTADYSAITIDEIYFHVRDYSFYTEAKSTLAESFYDIDEFLQMKGLHSSLSIRVSNEENILAAISRIQFIYQIVFALCFIIMSVLFITVMSYILKKKEKEIRIYSALGQKSFYTGLHYYIGYLLLIAAGALTGEKSARILSEMLLKQMTIKNFEIQKELFRYADITYEAFYPVELYRFDRHSEVFVLLVILGAFTCLFVAFFIKRRLKRHSV